MIKTSSVLGPDFGKRLIRVALAVVGLLILRAIVGALPMVEHAAAFGNSLLTPLVVTQAVIDTAALLVLLGFGLAIGRSFSANYSRLPELGRIIALAVAALALVGAYKIYQKPIACWVMGEADFGKCTQASAAFSLGDPANVMRLVLQGVGNAAGGSTARALQDAAAACLVSAYPAYGWTFLVLIAIPIIGIVVLISRNLDAITEIAFHAATAGSAPGPPGHGAGRRVVGSAAAGSPAGDAIEKLAKLKSLLDAGVISKEEFDGQKTALLGGSPPSAEPEELRKLKSLLEAGALTQEEYEAQRRRILARL